MKFFNKKRFKSLLAAFTILFAGISLNVYANSSLEIEYDILNLEIDGVFCECCGAHRWNLDLKQIGETAYVVNMQCVVCLSELHLTGSPIEFDSLILNNK
ncbi:MAG: hypothetical protein IKY70_01975 [Bacteroidales bacterium]|nr:hypothetical protein [Bacteroidales bacterium]